MPDLELVDSPLLVPVHDRSRWKAHKQLPRKRDYFESGQRVSDLREVSNLRPTDHATAQESLRSSESRDSLSNQPSLPLTPPSIPQEASQGASSEHAHGAKSTSTWGAHRSGLSTPTNQRSPPTPDITPPRITQRLSPLHPQQQLQQPSMSSRAESFKTAREDVSSDEDAERSDTPSERPSRQKWLHAMQMPHSGHIPPPATLHSDGGDATPTAHLLKANNDASTFPFFDGQWNCDVVEDERVPVDSPVQEAVASMDRIEQTRPVTPMKEAKNDHPIVTKPLRHATFPRRDRSLRERVQDSKQTPATSSTENFGETIGWSPTEESSGSADKVNNWRWSGVSTTSTIEAIVIDSPPLRKRTLRHIEKHASLRSVSSPIPRSNRSSWNSNTDSQRRLVHKAGTITNKNRWSMNSEISGPVSTTAGSFLQQPEQIHVVVIPHRRSSIKSSTSTSRRQSASYSQGSGGRRPTTAPDNGTSYFDIPRRRARSRSDSAPSIADSKSSDGGGLLLTRVVPPRSSSLSAPTSRIQSRAQSLTSSSLQLRTLVPEPLQITPTKNPTHISLAADSKDMNAPDEELSVVEWAPFRPASAHLTPFSQPSVQSSSPGAVEISEATAINLYPHNNRSLVVVEKAAHVESTLSQELRRSALQLHLNVEPSTPTASISPAIFADSPLKNPREPPIPPAFKVIPPTPAATTPTEEADRQLGPRPDASDGKSRLSRRLGSVRRALSARRYSETFRRSLNLNSNARNRKVNQELDNNLHPFWRPRGFWDDFSESESDDDYPEEDIIVNNSLGMPQKRIIFDGPLSLVRRISGAHGRSRSERSLRRQTSYSTITRSRMRSSRNGYNFPALRFHLRFVGLRDMQEKMQRMKQRKEDERRERRRQELRQSIGHNVIARGDSRFL